MLIKYAQKTKLKQTKSQTNNSLGVTVFAKHNTSGLTGIYRTVTVIYIYTLFKHMWISFLTEYIKKFSKMWYNVF